MKAPAVRYTLHRVGVGPLWRWVTVRADDASDDAVQALEGMFDGSSPNARLSRIKACAVAYPDDSRLADEIEWVEQRLQKSNGNAEWDELHALTAIERGLDLLHTRKHLAAVIERELRNEKDQARGARMATLPQGDKLHALIESMRAAGHGTARDVKQEIAERFGVGVPAVNKALRKRAR